MKSISCIIVEDEIPALNKLKKLILEHFSYIDIKAELQTVQDAYKAIIVYNPVIVFLDIKLGQESAFELLDKFENINFHVVFVTAHNNYALKAFDYPSPYYLVKPLNYEKLKTVVHRIQQLYFLTNSHENQAEYRAEMPGKLAFSSSNTTELIDFSKIEFLMADGSYTSLNLVDGSERVSSKILGHFEKSLDEHRFCRIHRKYIVNLDHIVRYDKTKSLVIHLSSGKRLQSSNIYKDNLLAKLKAYAKY
jgi:two-component system LytT family response regulator